MMKRTSSIFGLILAASILTPAFAQTKPAPAKPVAPAPQLAVAPAPAPTDVEKLTLENIQLKFSLLQTQLKALQTEQGNLQKEYQSTVLAIVAEHPGYQWDDKTSGLVAVPKATPSK